MAPPKSRWDDDDEEDEEEQQPQQQQQPVVTGAKRPAPPPTAAGNAAAANDDADEGPRRKRPAAAEEAAAPAAGKTAAAAALLDRALQEAAEFRQRMREQEEEAAAAAGVGARNGNRPRRVGLAALSEEEEEEAEARARARAEAAARARREREEEQAAMAAAAAAAGAAGPLAADLEGMSEEEEDDEPVGPAPPPAEGDAALPEPSFSASEEEEEQDAGAAAAVGPAPPPPPSAAADCALPLPSPPSSSSEEEEEQAANQQQPPAAAAVNTFESSDDELPPQPPPPKAAPSAAPATAAAPTTAPPIIAAASATRECRSVDAYEKLNRISEGTYGVVFRARDKRTGGIYALKRVKLDVGGGGGGAAGGGGLQQHGFPQTALREVGVLLALRHPNLVAVREVCVSSTHHPSAASSASVFVVMEYVQHDLRHLLDRQKAGELPPFSTAQVKCLFSQLLSGLEHLHSRWVLHRDLKTSNLLYGDGGFLKICDMGLARPYADPLRPYTPTVATLWYRPIERLLGQEPYSTELDCWAAGCILAELLRGEPLFQGRGEIDQIRRIFETLGTPAEDEWPGWEELPGCRTLKFPPKPKGRLRELLPRASLSGGPTLSDSGYDLLSGLLCLDPARRLSAAQALAHPWFREAPLPTARALMPAFPVQQQQQPQ
jgi:cell division cycle 2-like protein